MEELLPLNKIQLNFLKSNYREFGFCLLKEIFNKDELKSVWKKLEDQKYLQKLKNIQIYYEYKRSEIRRVEGLFDAELAITKYHLFILEILKNLIRSPIIFKDKLNIKYPGKGSGFRAHVDGHFYFPLNEGDNIVMKEGWQCYSHNFVNVLIPLLPMNEENGCLELASINQTKDLLGDSFSSITKTLGVSSPFIPKEVENKLSFEQIKADVGDIIIFDWKCIHRSKDNFSSKARPAFYLTYADSDDLDIRFKYYNDKLNSKNSQDAKSLH